MNIYAVRNIFGYEIGMLNGCGIDLVIDSMCFYNNPVVFLSFSP